MAHRYLPYIHNQVLELANPELPMTRKEMREKFKEELEEASGRANQDELKRNREFLALQDMLPVALRRTQAEETGKMHFPALLQVRRKTLNFPDKAKLIVTLPVLALLYGCGDTTDRSLSPPRMLSGWM